MIRAINVTNQGLDLRDIHTIPRDVSESLPRSSLRAGDIVLVYVGATIGKTTIIEENNKYHLGPNVAKIAAFAELIDPYFLLHQMRSQAFQYDLQSLTGSTSQPALSMENLRKARVIVPPLPEQRRIAAILSTWDAAITLTRRLIEALQQRKRALMDVLLTGQVRFPGFDGEWMSYQLSQLGVTYTGLSGKSGEDFGEGEFYIPYRNVFENSAVDPLWLERVSISDNERQNRVDVGDILFTVSSETPDEVGMSSVLLDDLGECYLNSFCFGLRLHDFETLMPHYARYLFRSQKFRHAMLELAQGSTRYNISKREVLKIEVSIPTTIEQEKIANLLSALDDQLVYLNRQSEHLQAQKRGLMQKLLTGAVRVQGSE